MLILLVYVTAVRVRGMNNIKCIVYLIVMHTLFVQV